MLPKCTDSAVTFISRPASITPVSSPPRTSRLHSAGLCHAPAGRLPRAQRSLHVSRPFFASCPPRARLACALPAIDVRNGDPASGPDGFKLVDEARGFVDHVVPRRERRGGGRAQAVAVGAGAVAAPARLPQTGSGGAAVFSAAGGVALPGGGTPAMGGH